MKRIVCLICGCCILVSLFAQSKVISVSENKTVSLVFPFPILQVDRGTPDLLVQKVEGKVLLLKAKFENFKETNLTVVTSDGSVYSFRADYDHDPSVWIWQLPPQRSAPLSTYCNSILDNKISLHGIRDQSWEMKVKVTGIYIKGNVIFYQLRIENRSSVDYDIGLLKFFIRDQKRGRRTAVQENEVIPLYVAGNTKVVKGNAVNTVVIALNKFTIPDRKFLGIQILENNGGRNLQMRVRNNKIIKAVPLPDLQ